MIKEVIPAPDDPNVLFRRARSLHQAGELAQAIEMYRYLDANFTANAGTRLMLAIALAQTQALTESLAYFDGAIALAPNVAEAHYNRGRALQDLQRYPQALQSYERATEIRAAYPQAHLAKGTVLSGMGRWSEALRSLDRAVELEPTLAGAHVKRAAALAELGRTGEALTAYERAIELAPGSPDAWLGRGALLHGSGRLEDALQCFDRAIGADVRRADAYYNKASVLRDVGELGEALRNFDIAIQIDPAMTSAYWNKGLIKLLLGDYREGWSLYEYRQRDARKRSIRSYPQPLWSGDEPLGDKTVLLYGEQGLGDVIQFCRYLPMLARVAGHVVFEVPAPLLNLMQALRCRCSVVQAGRPLPPFDLHCPMMSLPRIFGTTLETVPAEAPYLFADRRKSALWSEKLGPHAGLRVGLAWAGGARERTDSGAEQLSRDIPLACLEPLNIPGVSFYSLQKGSAAERELRELRLASWRGPDIVDFTADLSDLSDTAALIDNLDMVVSVCTSVTHLAGAMGKRTWVLLQHRADWRWLRDRVDSPWYPTATLYRQSSANDWTGVVNEVRSRLTELVASSPDPSSRRSSGRHPPSQEA